MQLFIRHLLAALGAFTAAHGVTISDTNSTSAVLVGLILWLVSFLWSWQTKTRLDDTTSERIRKLVGALVSQGLSGLAGVMEQQGFTGNPDDLGAVSLFLGNLGVAKLGWHQKALGVPPAANFVKVLIGACCLMSLSSCQLWERPGVKSFTLTTTEGVLMLAKMELDAATADWAAIPAEHAAERLAKALAVKAKEDLYQEALKAVARERAKLDKQPVNLVPGG